MRSCGCGPALVPLVLMSSMLAACAPAQRAPTQHAAAQQAAATQPAAAQSKAAAGTTDTGPGADNDREDDNDRGVDEDAEAAAEAAVVAAIEQAVNQTQAARHDCWARAAADDHQLAGRVTVRVQFAQAAGPTVTIREDEPGDPVLTRCLVAVYQAHAWPETLAPGTVIELPFGFEAPRYQYTVSAQDVAPLPLPGPLKARVLLHERNTGNPDIALVLVTMEPSPAASQARWEAPADGRTTRLFYVIDGAIELAAPRGGKSVRVAAGQAVAIPPDQPHAVGFAPDAPVTMVQITVPAGAALWPLVENSDEASGQARARRDRRKGKLPAVQARPQVFPIAGGQAQVSIFYDRAGGHEAASLAMIVAPGTAPGTTRPGMTIPAHVHAHETEMVLVLEGSGTMTIAGERYPFAPMTAIQIPPGVEHAVVFAGDAPVRALQVYTPSGPEQRFRQPPRP